jgi:hypothetical protein
VAVSTGQIKVATNGIGSVSMDLGLRYRYGFCRHLLLTATLYTNWMIPEKDDSSYLGADQLPFNSRIVFAANVGIAYKFSAKRDVKSAINDSEQEL